MDSQARYHIQEWLSKTAEESGDPYTLEGAFPGISPVQIREPHAFRQTDPGADLSIPSAQISNLDNIPVYGRKARHKTKEDRYEYKGKMTNQKDKSRSKEKKMAANRIRKHTINDYFHASNVPLRRSLDMGIFKKGKSSTPVKSRQVPWMFSEVNFLSRSSFSNPERLSTAQRGGTEGPKMQSIANASERPLTNHDSNNLLTEKEVEVPFDFASANNLIGKAQVDTSLEESLEIYTKRLLHFDLRSWETNEIVSKVDSTRKYSTLEDLKTLLEQRIGSWHLGQEQRKRKRSPAIESVASTLDSKLEQQHRDSRTQVIQNFEPRHEDVAFNFSGAFHEPNEDVNEDLEHEGPCRSPSHDEGRHDSIILGQEITGLIKPANLSNHAESAIYAGNSCEDSLAEMDWKFDEPLAFHGTERDLMVDHREDLVFNALDAAYGMIVDSDKGSMYEALDGEMRLSDDSVMDDYETTNLIQQGYQSWGILEDEYSRLPTIFSGVTHNQTLRPYFGDQRHQEQFFGKRFSPETGQKPSEMRSCARQFPARQQERSGQQATDALGPEEEFLHGLKGFWRQNKLY